MRQGQKNVPVFIDSALFFRYNMGVFAPVAQLYRAAAS